MAKSTPRVLLATPHETAQLGYTNPPLGLLYLAGTLVAEGIDVRVVDGCREGKEAVLRAIEEYRPDLVGVTCLTPGRKKALEVARMAKEADPAVTTVLGGPHATIMHRQLLENYPFLDYAACGEGEGTLLDLVRGKDPSAIPGLAGRDVKGVPRKNRPRPNIADLDDIPFPAWHLLDLRAYPPRSDGRVRDINGVDVEREPRLSVVFSRGCMGHCDFCSTWWIWRTWRHRSGKNMADELEMLYREFGMKSFCFADDAMTVDRQAVMDLCSEILSRGLRIAFTVTTRTDCVDKDLLERMREAGCYLVNFGIETGSQALLDAMGKENDVEVAETAILMAREAGISTHALMISGNVGETDETVAETVRFLKRSKPDSVSAEGFLMVLPGTTLYQRCKRGLFVDDEFWLRDEPYMIYTLEYPMEKLKAFHKRIAACNRQRPIRVSLQVLRYKPLTLPRRVFGKIRRTISPRAGTR